MNYEELKSLLDNAGVPAYLGSEYDIKDWPDPETFEENLTVHGIDKTPLKFKLPDISDMEIVGVEEVKEEFVSFPPFADIKDLLKPISIPDEYLQKDTPQPPSGAIKQESAITSDTQTVEDVLRVKDASTLSVKREREESIVSVSSELQNQSRKKAMTTVTDSPTLSIEEGSQVSPMEQDPSVSFHSGIEILDSELDNNVIDLTQDV